MNVVNGCALRHLVPLEILEWDEDRRVLSITANTSEFFGIIRVKGKYNVVEFVMRTLK